MEVVAIAKSIRVSPRKVRLVADTIRKKSVSDALSMLSLTKKRGSDVLEKLLKSAISNAKQKNMKEELLAIKTVEVGEGQALKRYHPSTRGRVHPYKKRSSHIKIVLEEKGTYGSKS